MLVILVMFLLVLTVMLNMKELMINSCYMEKTLSLEDPASLMLFKMILVKAVLMSRRKQEVQELVLLAE